MTRTVQIAFTFTLLSCLLLYSVFGLLNIFTSFRPLFRTEKAGLDKFADRVSSDYELDDETRKCVKIFSQQYLITAASQTTSHCDSSSESILDCFHPPREPVPHPWPHDLFCIAQDVSLSTKKLSNTAASPAVADFSLPCRLDDVFNKADTNGDQWQDTIATPRDYFFKTGVTHQLASWRQTAPDPAWAHQCNTSEGGRNLIVLVKRGRTRNLWDSFMEVWQAMISVDILRIAGGGAGRPYITDHDLSRARIVFEDDDELPFEEWWQLVLRNGLPTSKLSELEPGCLDIILPLPGSSSPMYTALFDSQFHRSCRESSLVGALQHRMFRHYGLEAPSTPPSSGPLITIIDRKGTRKIWEFETLLHRVRSYSPEANITVVDFAQLTLRDQVRLASETDVLVGIHGAGLTHSLWLNPTAAVVEFKPPLFPGGLGYVAQLNGASYFEGRTLWPEIWNLTVNNVSLPIGWLAPESDSGWQSHEYVYVDPDDFVELIDAALRSQAHATWEPPLKATCVSNGCHYESQERKRDNEFSI
ncbi:hypothetical protein F5883DRAFT_508988 [Diaporthe sp. PMI_573]|nr:hypothetical protein F5883DRAFT_508988 [Diaporthaceae sp. PMI_573]